MNYYTFHQQLRRARGKAYEHDCACGRTAREWAWNHTGPSETVLIVSFGTRKPIEFGTDPDTYEPMCKPCHVSLDRGGRSLNYPCGHPRAGNSYIRKDGTSYCRSCKLAYDKNRREVARGN